MLIPLLLAHLCFFASITSASLNTMMGQKPKLTDHQVVLDPAASAVIRECHRRVARSQTPEQMEAAVRDLQLIFGHKDEPKQPETSEKRKSGRTRMSKTLEG